MDSNFFCGHQRDIERQGQTIPSVCDRAPDHQGDHEAWGHVDGRRRRLAWPSVGTLLEDRNPPPTFNHEQDQLRADREAELLPTLWVLRNRVCGHLVSASDNQKSAQVAASEVRGIGWVVAQGCTHDEFNDFANQVTCPRCTQTKS